MASEIRHPFATATSQNEFGTERLCDAMCIPKWLPPCVSIASSAMANRGDAGDHLQAYSYGRR